jgi:hypothetical protein
MATRASLGTLLEQHSAMQMTDSSQEHDPEPETNRSRGAERNLIET